MGEAKENVIRMVDHNSYYVSPTAPPVAVAVESTDDHTKVMSQIWDKLMHALAQHLETLHADLGILETKLQSAESGVMYLEVDAIKNKKVALEAYIQVLQEWIEHVYKYYVETNVVNVDLIRKGISMSSPAPALYIKVGEGYMRRLFGQTSKAAATAREICTVIRNTYEMLKNMSPPLQQNRPNTRPEASVRYVVTVP